MHTSHSSGSLAGQLQSSQLELSAQQRSLLSLMQHQQHQHAMQTQQAMLNAYVTSPTPPPLPPQQQQQLHQQLPQTLSHQQLHQQPQQQLPNPWPSNFDSKLGPLGLLPHANIQLDVSNLLPPVQNQHQNQVEPTPVSMMAFSWPGTAGFQQVPRSTPDPAMPAMMSPLPSSAPAMQVCEKIIILTSALILPIPLVYMHLMKAMSTCVA